MFNLSTHLWVGMILRLLFETNLFNLPFLLTGEAPLSSPSIEHSDNLAHAGGHLYPPGYNNAAVNVKDFVVTRLSLQVKAEGCPQLEPV